MSLAYKVEELLALRDSVSESAVSIDRFADEDVIKEHVLRPSASASANLASRSSARSLKAPVVQPLASAAPQKKTSPTPSIKRGKAEKLLKEHGSPPGMRVTAGGRIVPSDLPPLGTSRFPDNTFKPSALRATPGNIMSTQAQLNNNSAARIEVVGGQPVICIGDRMFALPAVDSSSTPSMGGHVAMEAVNKHQPVMPALNTNGSMPGLAYGPPRTSSTSPFAGLDLPTLKAQQSLKKQELRTVEQTEVLQSSHQTEAWRANMIEKKRNLIVKLDALRKAITALENENGATSQNSSFLADTGLGPGTASHATFVPQLQQSVPQVMYPFPGANPCTPMMMYPPPYSTFPNFPAVESAPFVAPPVNPPHSPGSSTRRSHAIAIKPPQDIASKPALNPKSPTYEPHTKSITAQGIAPVSPSPPKRSSWRTQEEPQPGSVQRPLSQKPSFSSIDTTDFFPTNTHEHSSTRLAPRPVEPKQHTHDSKVAPSTPEKHWPASPWNEGNSGRSKKNESTSKLTSWPEAFGKQQCSFSWLQSGTGQPSADVSERVPVMGPYDASSTQSNNRMTRADSEQRSGVNENWPFSRKAFIYAPSTYQEGYQAGYDHFGMPDSPEVLQGFAQGLLHFLADESKKSRPDGPMRGNSVQGKDSRTPSLRGLVAESLPHDSAVSMTFSRDAGQSANYENVHLSKDSLSAKMYRESGYTSQGSIKETQNRYAHLNEAAYVPRRRNVPSMQFPSSTNPVPDRPAKGRQDGFQSDENEVRKARQDKGITGGADGLYTNGSFGRQFSGAQVQNRGYGTPLSTQRFYPMPKDMGANGSVAPTMMGRFVDHRLSGLDGAMDDLADIVMETRVDEQPCAASSSSGEALVAASVEVEEATASCFKPSSGKGKVKGPSSPNKGFVTKGNKEVSSPNPPSSPKKAGEVSPAKAKLEQVTNKFRRNKKDEARMMSPEDKTRRSDKWRKRFQAMKREELEEIEEHVKNTRV